MAGKPKIKLLSRAQLSETITKMIREALVDEAGPLGYLSKTARPDPKTSWDPQAQDKWAKEKEAQFMAGKGPTGPTGTEMPPPPPAEPPEKTVAPMGKAKIGGLKTPAPMPSGGKTEIDPAVQAPAPTPPANIADVTRLLQNASAEELEQIKAMLAQTRKPV